MFIAFIDKELREAQANMDQWIATCDTVINEQQGRNSGSYARNMDIDAAALGARMFGSDATYLHDKLKHGNKFKDQHYCTRPVQIVRGTEDELETEVPVPDVTPITDAEKAELADDALTNRNWLGGIGV
jgi:hypothetical protein